MGCGDSGNRNYWVFGVETVGDRGTFLAYTSAGVSFDDAGAFGGLGTFISVVFSGKSGRKATNRSMCGQRDSFGIFLAAQVDASGSVYRCVYRISDSCWLVVSTVCSAKTIGFGMEFFDRKHHHTSGILFTFPAAGRRYFHTSDLPCGKRLSAGCFGAAGDAGREAVGNRQ